MKWIPTKIVVTGGAGFIGSAMIRYLLARDIEVINIDKLTYAGHLASLAGFDNRSRYHFYPVDICDAFSFRHILIKHQPDGIIHLAAESHVDRSIDDPRQFMQTNIMGTFTLLDESLRYWREHPDFRFHHVSTDEVFGSLDAEGFFDEMSPYQPNSPYSASKASSDHLVRAWHHTYGLPVTISNCSNNYGPFQSPEKLIPHMIIKAQEGKALPIYGNGYNVRDWLYVDDHVDAIWKIFTAAKNGETYLIGGQQERTNQAVVERICCVMDEYFPKNTGSYLDQITYVHDRPGHDMRYAIDPRKIIEELAWQPKYNFEQGLQKTVLWYLHNQSWWKSILEKETILERQGVI